MLAGRAVVARAVMFSTAGAGSGQQVGGQDPGNVNPMSPTRAEAGCAGVPLPPSTPSSASRQQQANGQEFVNPSFRRQRSQGFVPGFLGSVPGAGFGNVGSGLNPSMPVGSGLDPSRATMFGPYGRLSPDLSGQCLNPSAVAGEALSGMAPPPGNLNRQLVEAVWIRIRPLKWLPLVK